MNGMAALRIAGRFPASAWPRPADSAQQLSENVARARWPATIAAFLAASQEVLLPSGPKIRATVGLTSNHRLI